MAISWIFILMLGVLSLLYLVYTMIRSPKYVYPPGPRGWPIVGNILDMSSLHMTLTGMAQKYGDILRLNVLGLNIIVLNTPGMVRKAFASDEFAEMFTGRPKTFIGTYTIISRATTYMAPTSDWTKRRKLLHKTIKMYGSGAKEQEVTMKSELEHVIKKLTNEEGLHTLEDVFLPSLVNIMTILILGRRFDYDDTRLRRTVEMYNWGNKMATVEYDVIMMILPFLRHFSFGYGKYYQKFQQLFAEFTKHYYDEQKATFDPSISRGLVDVVLKQQMEDRAEHGRSWIEDDDVKAIAFDTIGAGVLTSRGALLSFFLTILHKPEIAKRIQTEIADVIGPDRSPSLTDRQFMSYTEACILETLRFISHVPLALPHCTTKDIAFENYLIPANTLVFANLWAVHHDETLWDDPWEFKPERFLDDNGKLLPLEHPNRRNLMPFSIGRRACLGEGFAKSRIFLYITSLLQKFDFKVASPDEKIPPLDPRQFVLALVLTPVRYRVQVVPR